MNFIQQITTGEKDAKDGLSEAHEQAQKNLEAVEQKEKEALSALEETLQKEQQEALEKQSTTLQKKSEEAVQNAESEASALALTAAKNKETAVKTVLTQLGA